MFVSRYLPLTPKFGRQSFRTSLQEVALQAGRLCKAVHRYRDDFHVKKIISPLKNLLSAVIQGPVKLGETTGIPPNAKHSPGDFIHSFLQLSCTSHFIKPLTFD